jgi:cytochrome P450
MAAATDAPSDPLFSAQYFEHPEDVIARLRRNDPVHFIAPIDAWIVTRYADVRQLFTDPNVTNDRRAYARYVAAPEGSYLRWIAENGLFSAPVEEHARMRRQVAAGFTPGAIQRMEKQIREVVEQFAAPLRGRRGVVDLRNEFVDPIPNTVISRITGVPAKEADEARFRELARDVLSGISPLLDEQGRRRAENAMLELCDWIRRLCAERKREPREDLVSDLVHDDTEGGMSDEQIILLVAGLVAAGTETTSLGGTLALRTLFRHPEQMEQLRRDRSLLPGAVNELLRFDFGSAGLPRYALRDFELRGRRIRKGQLILLSFLGAHRDPDVFPDPDRFDLHRDTKDLTIFGHGPHYCLGANLARSELRCMLDAALDFLPRGARLVEDEIGWMRLGMFSRIEKLPVDFGS